MEISGHLEELAISLSDNLTSFLSDMDVMNFIGMFIHDMVSCDSVLRNPYWIKITSHCLIDFSKKLTPIAVRITAPVTKLFQYAPTPTNTSPLFSNPINMVPSIAPMTEA